MRTTSSAVRRLLSPKARSTGSVAICCSAELVCRYQSMVLDKNSTTSEEPRAADAVCPSVGQVKKIADSPKKSAAAKAEDFTSRPGRDFLFNFKNHAIIILSRPPVI